jgi:thiol:disulfide interchange protein DsbD
MRAKTAVLFLLVTMLMVAASRAAHTQVQLLLSAETAKPGDTIWAGVDLKMDTGWHTYWKNPGDAGEATDIKWQLPPGVTAGQIRWPLPEKLPPAEVTTYGYENEVVLLVPLTLASNLPAGPLNLAAGVSWLECKEECVPASTNVGAVLNVGGETKTSAAAAMIQTWKKKVPAPDDPAAWFTSAWWEKPATGDKRPLIIDRRFSGNAASQTNLSGADFFPDAGGNFEIQSATETITASSGEIRLRKLVQKFSGGWPKEISGVIVMENGGLRTGIDVKMSVGNPPPAGETVSTTSNPFSSPPSQPLWRMLIYAFIGGLILNIMPCVLPVIALKILGFVSEARSEPRRVRNLGLVYTLGVLASFLALAAAVIGVKTAGHHAGWGMQFGSPVFIVCLTTLVTLVALNLFGVFEVTLGGRALDAAGGLASKHGAPGAFFNGVLATTLATPCTAPFLAPALGFAFSQPSATIVLIFLTVGLGLASPYVLLSCNPAWLRFLPKPGVWMEKFKVAMGFPMLATAVWLFNLAYDDYSKNVLWLGIFLVIVAMAAWVFGEFVQRGRRRKAVALIVTLILLVGGYTFALENELDWRTAMPQTGFAGPLKESPDGIDWQAWSPAAVAAARAAGRPVLVDFTADWCLTCQVNKKTSLEIPSVRAKLKALHAVALTGDYTHFPDAITTELNRYNRAGVPLVLVYPKDASAPPIVLPAVLTPGIVLDALDRAGR